MENISKKTRTELLKIAKRVKEDQIGGKREPGDVQISDRVTVDAKKL